MVYGSAFCEEFRDAAGFGWDAGEPGFDIKILMEKKVRALTPRPGRANPFACTDMKVHGVKPRAALSPRADLSPDQPQALSIPKP